MKKSAAILVFLPVVLYMACLLVLSSAAAQDAGICPSSTMPGELEFPQDMLFDVEELDDDPADGRIAPGSCANITIFKGGSSYTWQSSDPVNFSLSEDEHGATNQICLSKDACGSATITVTAADGYTYMFSVLSLMGRWGDWTAGIFEDDPCAGEYYASNTVDYCSDKSRQYNAAFWGAQAYHDECATSWVIYSQNCSATFHAFPGFWRISAAFIRERQWICGSLKTTD